LPREVRKSQDITGSKMKKKDVLFFSIVAIVIILDQITKYFIVKKFEFLQSKPLITNVLHLTYIQNTGAGFGILQDQTIALIWLSIIVIGIILFVYDKIQANIQCVFTALILGGTIGNLIDRIRLNYVVDFIDFRIWPAFNVADSALTVGIFGLLIYFFVVERKSFKR